MSDDTNQELVINYSHYIPAHCKNQDGEMDGDFYEKCQVKIPFPLFYPVRWMEDLFEADKTPIIGLCDEVTGFEVTFDESEFETEQTVITRMLYEAFLKRTHTDSNQCRNCYSATVSYCDKLYKEMLSNIGKSIVRSMLCLKHYKIQRDVIKLIGQVLWNTRHEMIWLQLKST